LVHPVVKTYPLQQVRWRQGLARAVKNKFKKLDEGQVGVKADFDPSKRHSMFAFNSSFFRGKESTENFEER
jgi:hypothetical protein